MPSVMPPMCITCPAFSVDIRVSPPSPGAGACAPQNNLPAQQLMTPASSRKRTTSVGRDMLLPIRESQIDHVHVALPPGADNPGARHLARLRGQFSPPVSIDSYGFDEAAAEAADGFPFPCHDQVGHPLTREPESMSYSRQLDTSSATSLTNPGPPVLPQWKNRSHDAASSSTYSDAGHDWRDMGRLLRFSKEDEAKLRSLSQAQSDAYAYHSDNGPRRHSSSISNASTIVGGLSSASSHYAVAQKGSDKPISFGETKLATPAGASPQRPSHSLSPSQQHPPAGAPLASPSSSDSSSSPATTATTNTPSHRRTFLGMIWFHHGMRSWSHHDESSSSSSSSNSNSSHNNNNNNSSSSNSPPSGKPGAAVASAVTAAAVAEPAAPRLSVPSPPSTIRGKDVPEPGTRRRRSSCSAVQDMRKWGATSETLESGAAPAPHGRITRAPIESLSPQQLRAAEITVKGVMSASNHMDTGIFTGLDIFSRCQMQLTGSSTPRSPGSAV
ncbi:hypothetical protein CXG81DRAFT_19503 [Caulochytrium protostelioides]|uniref:Uncharacterized protein n=1 Tax=Caulochytrium protostelioides TaxID=1555241 RepID=A0A4P9X5Y0_9FUNG|nr:hypothetical protein CXG81DRAFT_19503 [Caulochytrium protostelioides]|eukprot:RKP00548.1 hypothetical protein CXG81DRAFT_19503 [Caulochytrium protostelioides]